MQKMTVDNRRRIWLPNAKAGFLPVIPEHGPGRVVAKRVTRGEGLRTASPLCALLLACVSILLAPLLRAREFASTDVPATCYLFSYFINEKDGLHLAWSKDGLKWQAFMEGNQEKIFLKPAVGEDKLMRDPCILFGPDKVFRLVWTDSWHDQTIGCASSEDLLNWSRQQALPVMKYEPTSRNTWAPEIHYDEAGKQYLIFWSSTIPGRFPGTDHTSEDDLDHRIYLTTTADFATYTPTALFFDPKFCAIDATILPFHKKFYMIFKNETLKPEPAKNLYLASSDSMTGPYTNITGPLATTPAHWLEGPTAIQIADKVIIYYDCYQEGHFGACESADMRTWADITPQLSLPKGIRHGTVIAVPGPIISNLIRALANPAAPAKP